MTTCLELFILIEQQHSSRINSLRLTQQQLRLFTHSSNDSSEKGGRQRTLRSSHLPLLPTQHASASIRGMEFSYTLSSQLCGDISQESSNPDRLTSVARVVIILHRLRPVLHVTARPFKRPASEFLAHASGCHLEVGVDLFFEKFTTLRAMPTCICQFLYKVLSRVVFFFKHQESYVGRVWHIHVHSRHTITQEPSQGPTFQNFPNPILLAQ